MDSNTTRRRKPSPDSTDTEPPENYKVVIPEQASSVHYHHPDCGTVNHDRAAHVTATDAETLGYRPHTCVPTALALSERDTAFVKRSRNSHHGVMHTTPECRFLKSNPDRVRKVDVATWRNDNWCQWCTDRLDTPSDRSGHYESLLEAAQRGDA